MTVSVQSEGSGTRVLVTESEAANPLAARGRLVWAVSVSNRFIKTLTEVLLQPSAGWLADPSGRFAQRWWDGCAWTSRARDHERGTQFEDLPGSLAPPSIGGRRSAGSAADARSWRHGVNHGGRVRPLATDRRPGVVVRVGYRFDRSVSGTAATS